MDQSIDTDAIASMLFTNQRLMIAQMKLNGDTAAYIPDAYAYAWDRGVCPIMHEAAHWHRPYESHFDVTRERLEDLIHLLAERRDSGNLPNFYDLESHYEIGVHSRSGWNRARLIHALRYLKLYGAFDDAVWEKLLEPMQHPTEATSIYQDYDEQDMLLV